MMLNIPYQETGYFTKIICDYLEENKELQEFYDRFSTIEAFEDQINDKEQHFSELHRSILSKSLLEQNAAIKCTSSTKKNLEALKSSKTFCVTTGHQLNLFTGPLYFLYKIIGAINLTKQLKELHPSYNFVPIYWMATEDHDFEEIQYFNFKEKKISWQNGAKGAVGRLSTAGLDKVWRAYADLAGSSKNAQYLIELFRKAYLTHDKLGEAHRFLVNELFGDFGLVIVDGDDIELKRIFSPYMREELEDNASHKTVIQTIDKLSPRYKIQVNPREINLFYLRNNFRERIIKEGQEFYTVEGAYRWNRSTILAELDSNPERFSPNVIMRPLYQEVVLPNLCYIGGGGEIAYWFQLKAYFESQNIPFPILLLRNSVLSISEKQVLKMKKLGLNKNDIFLNQETLLKTKTKELSKIDIDFSPQREVLKSQFIALEKLAEQTDKSFIGAVKAQEAKQLKGLNNLEKRLLKAEKKNLKDVLSRMTILQNELFPNGSLEERTRNFSELYLKYGAHFIPTLVNSLEPLKLEFSILNFDKA